MAKEIPLLNKALEYCKFNAAQFRHANPAKQAIFWMSTIEEKLLGQPIRKKARALTHSGMGRLQVCWQSMLQ